MIKFQSKIYKIGINAVVDPPGPVMKIIFAEASRSMGPIPVVGTLDGAQFIQTLVKYQGVWRLYINGPMLKASGLKIGDTANIQIEFDPRPRDVQMPPPLASAFQKNQKARAAFDKLTPSRQKEILRYIGSLKTQESIDENVSRILSHLRGEVVDHVLTRPKRSRRPT